MGGPAICLERLRILAQGTLEGFRMYTHYGRHPYIESVPTL